MAEVARRSISIHSVERKDLSWNRAPSKQNQTASQSTQPTCDCCQDSARRAPDAAARFLDGRRRGGARRERAWQRVAGRPRLGAGESDSRCVAAVEHGEVIARVAGEGAVRDALAEAARRRFALRGTTRTQSAACCGRASRTTGTSPSTFVNDSDFYTKDQQAIIRNIFEGIISPEWHERIDKQLDDDSGGYGEQNSIAIFGEPGSEKFEFVMTGRHMTIRCDGNSADHVAFGGPIFYGHAAEGFQRRADAPGQRVLAAGAGGQQAVRDARRQAAEAGAVARRACRTKQHVGFHGKKGEFQGLPVTRSVERSEGAPAEGHGDARRAVSPERSRRGDASASRRKAASMPATWRTTPQKRHRQRRRVGHLAAGRPVVRVALSRRTARARVGQRGG